jgi:hypothetical protein
VVCRRRRCAAPTRGIWSGSSARRQLQSNSPPRTASTLSLAAHRKDLAANKRPPDGLPAGPCATYTSPAGVRPNYRPVESAASFPSPAVRLDDSRSGEPRRSALAPCNNGSARSRSVDRCRKKEREKQRREELKESIRRAEARAKWEQARPPCCAFCRVGCARNLRRGSVRVDLFAGIPVCGC